MSVLSIRDVCYGYEDSKKQVLNQVNMEFEPGNMYAIVGKSGSGKTTLLSLISGLDLCTKGSIQYHGTDLRRMNRDRYRSKEIGVVFQNYNLLKNATAIENLVLSMNISGVKVKNKIKEAQKLLEKVGINAETAWSKVSNLSGGEQQRVGIARALAHNPDVIIADEPTSNLDEETEESIMEILSSLVVNENKCVIVVTHSTKVASYASEVWGISNGRVLFVQ